MPLIVFLLTDTVFLFRLFFEHRKWAKNVDNFFLGFDSLVLENLIFLINLL